MHLGQSNGYWAFIKHLCKIETMHPFSKVPRKPPVPFLSGVRYLVFQLSFASVYPCTLGSHSTFPGLWVSHLEVLFYQNHAHFISECT